MLLIFLWSVKTEHCLSQLSIILSFCLQLYMTAARSGEGGQMLHCVISIIAVEGPSGGWWTSCHWYISGIIVSAIWSEEGSSGSWWTSCHRSKDLVSATWSDELSIWWLVNILSAIQISCCKSHDLMKVHLVLCFSSAAIFSKFYKYLVHWSIYGIEVRY